MQLDSASPETSEDLAAKAALRERYPEKWEPRFRRLLDDGVMQAPASMGSELALYIHTEKEPVMPALMVRTCLRHLVPAMQSGCSVGLDLSNVAPAGFSAWVQEFGRLLGAELAQANVAAGNLLFSISIGHPGVLNFLQLRGQQELGYPNVAVRFGADARMYQGEVWKTLMTLSHLDERIKMVPVQAARVLSGLHATERGQCVMPQGLFEVRANTAWVVLEIDAVRLTSPAFLRSELGLCLRFADNLIDSQSWALPALRLDALLNRRIALHISRLGQAVVNAGLNPTGFATLKRLQRWLWLVRKCLIRESKILALNRGPFPALGAAELVASLAPCYGTADANRLVFKSSVRNRNLLALSPHSVFPDESDGAISESCLNLIPAIGCADTLTMRGNDTRKRLRLNAWSRMLQMTGALAAGSGDYAQSYLS